MAEAYGLGPWKITPASCTSSTSLNMAVEKERQMTPSSRTIDEAVANHRAEQSQEPCGGVGDPLKGVPTTTATDGPGPGVKLTDVWATGRIKSNEGGSMFTEDDRQEVQHALDAAIKLDLHAQAAYTSGCPTVCALAWVDSSETKVYLRGTTAFAEGLLYMMDYDESPVVVRVGGKKAVTAEFEWTHTTLAGNNYPLHITLVKV